MKLRNKKTREIIDFEFVAISKETDELIAKTVSLYTHHAPVLICRSIDQLNEEWEDYEPKEPLIKDEKIRKAVRAWADFNGTYPIYWEDGCTLSINHSMRIEFSERAFAYLDVDKAYTIEELCGEEEE